MSSGGLLIGAVALLLQQLFSGNGLVERGVEGCELSVVPLRQCCKLVTMSSSGLRVALFGFVELVAAVVGLAFKLGQLLLDSLLLILKPPHEVVGAHQLILSLGGSLLRISKGSLCVSEGLFGLRGACLHGR